MRAHRLCSFLACVLVTAAAVSADDCPPKGRSKTELINPLLGPSWAQWLVGPVSCLASEKEIEGYLVLADDEAAARFVEDFWERHRAVEEAFRQRAEEADKRFREGTYVGHRTDRGTIFVIYGEPEEIFFEEYRDVAGPDVEHWSYPKKLPPGLDGRKPQGDYRFARSGDVTTFYREQPVDPHRRLRMRRPAPPR